MPATAKLHSKTLQVQISREELIELGYQGAKQIPVVDMEGEYLGFVAIDVSYLAQAAILSYMKMAVPAPLAERATREQQNTQKGGA